MSASPFVLFGNIHIITMLSILAASVFIPLIYKNKSVAQKSVMTKIIALQGFLKSNNFLIQEVSKKDLFFIGYSFGFGLWSLGISWLYVSIYFYGNLGFITSLTLTIIFIAILSLYLGATFS